MPAPLFGFRSHPVSCFSSPAPCSSSRSGPALYSPNLVVAAFAVVLLAQGCAAFLYARAWFAARKRVDETKRELSSIYRHVLDGILMLDDRGVCLEANPRRSPF
jgi:PAS domain-containing protein